MPRTLLPGPAEKRRLLQGLAQPPSEAARFLLGQVLVRQLEDRLLHARIVETEAYLGEQDPAAHAFGGRRTPRTEPLWGRPGTIYVYLIYGMYHCLNLSVDRKNVPGCVLIRAAEAVDAPGAYAGPGRLCRTLALERRHSGGHVFARGAVLGLREGSAPKRIGVSPRVGISQATDWPLRFFDLDSSEVSGPRRSR